MIYLDFVASWRSRCHITRSVSATECPFRFIVLALSWRVDWISSSPLRHGPWRRLFVFQCHRWKMRVIGSGVGIGLVERDAETANRIAIWYSGVSLSVVVDETSQSGRWLCT